MIAHIIQPELVIAFLWPVARQLINAVAQPVIVSLPVLLFDKVIHGLFNDGQPLRILGQLI